MSEETPADWRVWQNAETVSAFAEIRRGGIPGWREQLETLCQLLPETQGSSHPRVLDIGCGDGILLETVLRHWNDAVGVGLDGSEAMLDLARLRLGALNLRVENLFLADFNDISWRDCLGYRKFDAVISGFAIHHSEDLRKRQLYQEIFELLNPGGVFVNIEHVASASPHGERLFDRLFAAHIVRMKLSNGEATDFDTVLREHENRLDKSANRLAPVETQLQWIRDIGYADVDCYWKQYELVVLAGYKPSGS